MQELRINLLKKRRGISEKAYLRERKFFIWSIVFFVVVVIMGIIVLGLEIVFKTQLKKVKRAVAVEENKMMTLREASALQIYIKNRLILINKFLKERVDQREGLQRVFDLTKEGIVLGGVNFQGINKIVTILQADNLDSLSRAYKLLKDDDFFIEIVHMGIRRDERGQYNMKVVLTLPAQKEI